MFFLLEHYSFNEIIGFYKEKYPEHSVFRALMSFTYFSDAETQIMPKMLVPFEWEKLKNRIVYEIDSYGYIGVGRDDVKEKGEYAAIFYKKERLKLLESGNFWLSTTRPTPI